MNKTFTFAAVAAAVAVAGQAAHAQITTVTSGAGLTALSAGDTDNSVVPAGTTFNYGPVLVNGLTLQGNFVESVFSGDTFNPYGSSDLTFVVTIHNTPGNDIVAELGLNGFNLGSVGIGYEGTSAAPTFAQLTPGGTLNLNFTGFTGNSDTIYIYTSATQYAGNSATVQDGGVATTGDYAPVPEASTVMAGALMLLPLGIGAVRALRKERTA